MLEQAKALAAGRVDLPCSVGIEHGGRCYSNFYPLQPLLASPIVALLQALPLGGRTDAVINSLVHIVPVGAAVGCAVLVTAIARELGASRRPAIAAGVAMVLCTEMFVYARSFFAESLAAFLLTLGVYGYLRLEKRVVLTVTGTAGVVLAKPQLVFVVIALVLAASFGRPRRGLVLALAVGVGSIALATAIHVVANVARFDDATDFGGEARMLHLDALAPAAVIKALGLLTISPGRGILVYSPLIVVGFIALLVTRRRHRVAAMAIAILLGSLFLAVLDPGGGVNWGTRYLTPIMPLAAVGLASCPGCGDGQLSRPAPGGCS
jgi:hypothetical protein